MSNQESHGRLFWILVVAIAVVAGVSLCPLEKWTGGLLKDFNLVADLMRPDTLATSDRMGLTEIDPELLDSTSVFVDSLQMTDSLAFENDTIPDIDDPNLPEIQPNKQGDLVTIEDYTRNGTGLARLKASLATGGASRIAVVGDSYIEGDIFVQNVRENLQKQYGGRGVGYINLYSSFPGFRKSIQQSGSGWTEYQKYSGKKQYYGLCENYFTSDGSATAKYKGVNKLSNLDRWDTSSLLLVAPNGGKVMTKIAGGEWATHELAATDSVQCVRVDASTDIFELKVPGTSIINLGVWLDSPTGVTVDCMSSRGVSGMSLAKINQDLCSQMRRWVDYDLIVVEFGINAISPGQTNYNFYSDRMCEAIKHLRQCYPNSDIMIMSVGDRGEKRDGVVTSMKAVDGMIKAQRNVARRMNCLFWDTREAMGGKDAVVTWSGKGLINKDYVHLSHKGGEALAKLFTNALTEKLK